MLNSIQTEVVVMLAVVLLVIVSPLFLAIGSWNSKGASRIAAGLLGVSAAVLAFLAMVVDGVFGISGSWVFTLSVLGLGCGIALVIRVRYRSVFSLVVIGLLTIFALVQHFADLNPVKPYRRFFHAIEPHMTEAEVLTLLEQEFPDGFRFPRPVRGDSTQRHMHFYLNSGSAEAITVKLGDGRVSSKGYSRD